mmetsp:Transcript_48696/g.94143  ORF Transcript_48696/g.94143 Transcript_48696/m.94143 type:complete len:333 (-) Transcript_48696:249-1247(-)
MGQSDSSSCNDSMACCVGRPCQERERTWAPGETRRRRQLPSLFAASSSRLPIQTFYSFEETLGEGTFATVRKARMRSCHQFRAVKQVEKSKVAGQDQVLREIGILLTLDHPNICNLFETYSDSASFYLVMEFIDGFELYDELQENIRLKKLNEVRCSVIVEQLLAAVLYCHERGVVHRDLKPENIMVCTGFPYYRIPTIKVIDFGLALQAQKQYPMTASNHNTGVLEGSVAYLAPEVHDATCYSEASDMWSIGVIMFVMFLWRFPSQGDLHKEFLDISSVDARDLVEGLLKRDPRLRLVAAQAFKHPWPQQENIRKTTAFKKDNMKKNGNLV